MSENYNGYIVEGELTTMGSGSARWGFAHKNGEVYFLKEFLNPVYPENTAMFTEKQLKSKKEGCRIFQKEKAELYKRINQTSDGNAVRIEAFFRYGSKYYITMRKIVSMNYTPKNISDFPEKQKLLFCRILAHSLMQLHRGGIIHADIKWDNILFCQCSYGKLTVKLIDFDSSFLSESPPKDPEDMDMDLIYCAPETFLFLNEEPVKLDGRLDVYALGLIFHQIMTGKLPQFDKKYQYAFEAQLDGGGLNIDEGLPEVIKELIDRMLKPKPENRISSKEVFKILCTGRTGTSSESYKGDELFYRPGDL